MFSQEIISRIVHFVPESQLAKFCRINGSFQRAAEPRLYDQLYLGDPSQTALACHSLANNARLAGHVRIMWLYQDRRRTLSVHFWESVHQALMHTINLDVLVIIDPALSNSWILHGTSFQLREANFRFYWDDHLVEFLQFQRRLRSLQTMSVHGEFQPATLPLLQMYEGPLLVAGELLTTSPLTHLQAYFEIEALAENYLLIPNLALASKTLRTLSLLEVPEEISMGTFDRCSKFAPQLYHIGIFPLPNSKRHQFHTSLTRFSRLQVIELDLTGWVSRPIIPIQRILAAEIRTYCPTILCVALWFQNRRILWRCDVEDGTWKTVDHHDNDANRSRSQETLWKLSYPKPQRV